MSLLSEVEVEYRKKGGVKEQGSLPPAHMVSPPTGLLRQHIAGRGEGYGDISARRGLSETKRHRAITLFQQNSSG
ncbi:hypothetical protein BREVNS_1469 [Brevinematales bacterium NS]|nr:hypothetical protein BREVNS_1469 [Brevinematales bacterium NS]